MGSVQSGSGAGLSNQAKPDWSSSKSDAAKVDQAAQSGIASEVQQQPTVKKKADTSAASQVKAPETWSATLADLKAALAKLGIHRNDETTQQLALLMMQHGIEISEDNFALLNKVLKGRSSKGSLESAVISMSKGLQSSTAVTFLNSFFSQNAQLSSQIKDLQMALQSFQSLISSGKTFEQGIVVGLTSIISDLDDQFKQMLKKIKKGALPSISLERTNLVKDLYSVHQLLSGLKEKFKGGSLPKVLGQIDDVRSKIRSLMSNFVSQAILSKESEKQPLGALENFAYWQLPNIFGVDPRLASIDLLIKKDPRSKMPSINEERTKIVVNLETPDLGKLAIELVVMKKKVWYTFHTKDENVSKLVNSFQVELKKQMEAIGYQLSGYQALKQKVDIKKLLVPMRSLDDLTRINAEV